MSEPIKIAGLKQTVARLEQLPIKVEKSILRKGLRQGAKITLDAARAEAPQLSGRLKRNIKIRSGRSRKGSISLTVGVGAKDFSGETFYAGFVLYGHYVGSRKLGNTRKFVPADNFLERAFDETKEEAVNTTTDAWAQLIEEQA